MSVLYLDHDLHLQFTYRINLITQLIMSLLLRNKSFDRNPEGSCSGICHLVTNSHPEGSIRQQDILYLTDIR